MHHTGGREGHLAEYMVNDIKNLAPLKKKRTFSVETILYTHFDIL